jgi:hypothetical protein
MNAPLDLQLAGMAICTALGLCLGFRHRRRLFSDPFALSFKQRCLAFLPAFIMNLGLGFAIWASFTVEAWNNPVFPIFPFLILLGWALEHILIARLGFHNLLEPPILRATADVPVIGCALMILIYCREHSDATALPSLHEQYQHSKILARPAFLELQQRWRTPKYRLISAAQLLAVLALAAWGLTFVPASDLPDVIDYLIAMIVIGCYLYEIALLLQLPKNWRMHPLLWLAALVPVAGCAIIAIISSRARHEQTV